MSAIRRITVSEIQNISYRLAKQVLEWGEPIPDFQTRYGGILESCINQPFQTVSGQTLYPGLIKKAAILFYLMIKNHPFQNGNKRIAYVTLQVFLVKNNKWLVVGDNELYDFAIKVSASPMDSQPEIMTEIEELLQNKIIPIATFSGIQL